MANGVIADLTRQDAPARDRLWARYRDEEFADRLSSVPWNDALDTIMSHRSVRSYRDAPLPPGTLELLIAAAQSAATTSNLQAWSIIAVEDAARKALHRSLHLRHRRRFLRGSEHDCRGGIAGSRRLLYRRDAQQS